MSSCGRHISAIGRSGDDGLPNPRRDPAVVMKLVYCIELNSSRLIAAAALEYAPVAVLDRSVPRTL